MTDNTKVNNFSACHLQKKSDEETKNAEKHLSGKTRGREAAD